jgi:hypothetical protein
MTPASCSDSFEPYSGRLKYSPHLLKVGHILSVIFPHTDMLENFGFFFFERPLPGEHHRVKKFVISLALLFLYFFYALRNHMLF